MRAITRRKLAGFVGGAMFAWCSAPGTVSAQPAYPTRPVKLVLAFGPGGSVDVIARILGTKLGEAWGQPLVIDNKPGAEGDIAGEAVARAASDGYTLLMTSQSIAVNVTLRPKRSFKNDELTPIMLMAETQGVLVVPPTLEAKSVREVIALAKAQPGKLDYGSSGTSSHLFMELFRTTAGIDVVHVPFRNFGQWMTDMLAGRIALGTPTVPGVTAHIKAGRLRALGVTGARRSEALPEVATIADQLPGYAATAWYGLFTARGTPAAVIDRIHASFKAAMEDSTVRARFLELGVETIASSPAELASHLAIEVERWGKVVREAKIQAE